ncbi:MAG: zinc ribbon domain-containing protein [Rectinemataceae bacterium]|nr:zinc ribbon domain-containing protein [Rectinemataceae bacterium]
MPTYEYECRKCSHSFEQFQSMSEEPLKTCPKCGGDVRRLIGGGTGIIFKGSGFYVTDSKKASSAATVNAQAKSSKTEKSETAASASTEKAAPAGKDSAAGKAQASASRPATTKKESA